MPNAWHTLAQFRDRAALVRSGVFCETGVALRCAIRTAVRAAVNACVGTGVDRRRAVRRRARVDTARESARAHRPSLTRRPASAAFSSLGRPSRTRHRHETSRAAAARVNRRARSPVCGGPIESARRLHLGIQAASRRQERDDQPAYGTANPRHVDPRLRQQEACQAPAQRFKTWLHEPRARARGGSTRRRGPADPCANRASPARARRKERR